MSPKRRSSPAGYQRRHDANDSVSTGETLDARRAKSRRRGTSYNREWEMEARRQGVGSGQTVLLMGVQQNAPGGKGPDR